MKSSLENVLDKDRCAIIWIVGLLSSLFNQHGVICAEEVESRNVFCVEQDLSPDVDNASICVGQGVCDVILFIGTAACRIKVHSNIFSKNQPLATIHKLLRSSKIAIQTTSLV